MPPKRAAAAAADDAISTRPKRTKTSAAATPNDGSTTKTKPTAASKAAKATMAAANTAKKREPVNQAKTTAKSTAASKSKEKATATASKKTTKRKASEESEDKPVAKKTKAAPKAAAKAKPAPKPKAPPKAPKVVKLPPKKTIINKVPTQCLEVFVFGEGSAGELGLGTLRSQMDIKRPRLNPNLSADKIGIVEIDAGGMHVAALTHDNRIFTWGVNDQGALGRDTTWDGGLKDMDDATDSDDENSQADTGMNPHEANPAAIPEDAFPAGTTFVKVATSDSATWALTDDGHVWGWGTFRVSSVYSFYPFSCLDMASPKYMLTSPRATRVSLASTAPTTAGISTASSRHQCFCHN